KYSYITENDLSAFEGDAKLVCTASTQPLEFVDGSGSTVTIDAQILTYTYDGEVVMIRKERPTLSFAEISMDSVGYGREGMYYDEANSQNNLVGYCQSSSVSLRAYFARYRYDVTIDPNHSDANITVAKYNYGQHAVIEAPSRAGYDFGGWTWYKFSEEAGDYVLWDTDAPALNAQQQATFVVPGFSAKAVAKWTPAQFSQKITHYIQTSDLTFKTDAISSIQSGECSAAAAAILLDGSENAGMVYTSGEEIVGVSVDVGGLTYYYTGAVLEQGKYVVTEDDLAAIEQVVSVTQEELQPVSDFILNVPNCSFSYMLYQYKEAILSYRSGDSFDVCAGMQVDYYYTRVNDLIIGAESYITDGGSGNIVILGGGNHYAGENVVLNARVPAGFTFIGWYKAADVLEGYPADGTALSDYSLSENWASAAPVSESAVYAVKVKNSADYIALVSANAVQEPTITMTGKSSLVYGYSESANNAVNAIVRFADGASSANFVESYKWYVNGVEIENTNSATFLIPQGWSAGEYEFTCKVSVKRSDNLRSMTYSADFTVTVEKADISYTAANYVGSYNKQEHSISLSVKMPSTDYAVYYSETP
ncbi:MAG: InlB B-repeat-containing protein, partial [Oscillospiraceae bacterium]